MTRIYHVITPGDHFSPRTGSAIPTVVHGLGLGAAACGDAQRFPQYVVVQGDTYRPRYDTATALEYQGVEAPSAPVRYLDAALGVLGIPRRGNATYFAPAVRRLVSEPPGIVLAHNATVVPWLLRDSPHTPVLYAHNDLLRSYSRREATRVVERVALMVCVSESLAQQHRDRLPARLHDRICVVHNGVDANHFHPAQQPRDPGPLRVVFIGRVLPMKGPDVLLKAAALLDRTDVEYTIIGSAVFTREAELSSYEVELRRLAADVSVPVHFEAFVARPELPAALQRADIVVVPSVWQEPGALTIGESLATGLPLIASRMGGIPELVGDAGVLFDPHQPAELAAAIDELASDEERRASLGHAARARAVAHDWSWSWRALAPHLNRLTDAS